MITTSRLDNNFHHINWMKYTWFSGNKKWWTIAHCLPVFPCGMRQFTTWLVRLQARIVAPGTNHVFTFVQTSYAIWFHDEHTKETRTRTPHRTYTCRYIWPCLWSKTTISFILEISTRHDNKEQQTIIYYRQGFSVELRETVTKTLCESIKLTLNYARPWFEASGPWKDVKPTPPSVCSAN